MSVFKKTPNSKNSGLFFFWILYFCNFLRDTVFTGTAVYGKIRELACFSGGKQIPDLHL